MYMAIHNLCCSNVAQERNVSFSFSFAAPSHSTSHGQVHSPELFSEKEAEWRKGWRIWQWLHWIHRLLFLYTAIFCYDNSNHGIYSISLIKICYTIFLVITIKISSLLRHFLLPKLITKFELSKYLSPSTKNLPLAGLINSSNQKVKYFY